MSKKQAEKLRTIERKLRQGFVWYNTPQGLDYWAEVVQNLSHLRQAELQKTTGVKK